MAYQVTMGVEGSKEGFERSLGWNPTEEGELVFWM
jgi:hypothetical protein